MSFWVGARNPLEESSERAASALNHSSSQYMVGVSRVNLLDLLIDMPRGSSQNRWVLVQSNGGEDLAIYIYGAVSPAGSRSFFGFAPVRHPHWSEPPSPLPPFPAANFSTPVISTSGPATRDQGLTLTCISRNGYPKPNLYWINRTDNSLIDEALQNNTVSLNEWGLYDVISTLTVPWVAHVNVSCSIENVVLHQNLTSVSQAGEAQAGVQGLSGHPGYGIGEAQS